MRARTRRLQRLRRASLLGRATAERAEINQSSASANIARYASRAFSYAAAAASRSLSRIFGDFAFQQTSTASRHHWALFLLARIGRPWRPTNTGLVCALAKT